MKNFETKLTVKDSYKVMFFFLEELYKMTGSNDLGGFLGGFSISKEHEDSLETYDTAAWNDWLKAVDKLSEENQFNKK